MAGTGFVHHPIFLFALQPSLHLDNGHLLFRQPDGIVAFWTEILAQGCGHGELLDYSIRPLKKMKQEAVPVFS